MPLSLGQLVFRHKGCFSEPTDISPGTSFASTLTCIFAVALGQTVLAKSTNPDRIDANKGIVDLDASELKVLTDWSDELTRKNELKRYVYPPFGINFGFPDKQ